MGTARHLQSTQQALPGECPGNCVHQLRTPRSTSPHMVSARRQYRSGRSVHLEEEACLVEEEEEEEETAAMAVGEAVEAKEAVGMLACVP